MNVVHAWPNRTGTDVDTEALDWRAGLLAPVVRLVVEGALEAELDAHLADRSQIRPCGVQRRNARNGSRSKTVRTAFGEVTIDAPRDRWGTFDPVVVGKWQRRVVGVDQLTVPLAALGADEREGVALLGRVYRGPQAAGLATSVLARGPAPAAAVAPQVACRARPARCWWTGPSCAPRTDGWPARRCAPSWPSTPTAGASWCRCGRHRSWSAWTPGTRA